MKIGKAVLKGFKVWRKHEIGKRILGKELTSERIEYHVPEGRRMQLNIGTRTSTNALIGGGLGAQIYVQLIDMLPWPALAAALTTPEAIALAATAFAWAVARVSRTPQKPGAL